MHVGDGQLSGPVVAAGVAGAVAGLTVAVRRLDDERIPKIAVLSSLFFAVSLWHVPLPMPGASIHLVATGLLGLLLGRDTFIAVPMVLGLQAVLFGHGGITTLGVNTLAMAVPGPLLARAIQPMLARDGVSTGAMGFLLGSGAVLLGTAVVAICYVLSDMQYLRFLPAYFVAQLPLIVAEGILTATVVSFLARARPDLIGRRKILNAGGGVDA